MFLTMQQQLMTQHPCSCLYRARLDHLRVLGLALQDTEAKVVSVKCHLDPLGSSYHRQAVLVFAVLQPVNLHCDHVGGDIVKHHILCDMLAVVRWLLSDSLFMAVHVLLVLHLDIPPYSLPFR